jgi:hypothetical protein
MPETSGKFHVYKRSDQRGERSEKRSNATPVDMSIFVPNSPRSDLRSQSAKKALRAASSNRASPVRRLRVANSRMSEPAPAVPAFRPEGE